MYHQVRALDPRQPPQQCGQPVLHTNPEPAQDSVSSHSPHQPHGQAAACPPQPLYQYQVRQVPPPLPQYCHHAWASCHHARELMEVSQRSICYHARELMELLPKMGFSMTYPEALRLFGSGSPITPMPPPQQQYAYPAQYPYAPPAAPPYYGAPQYPQQAPSGPTAWSVQVPPHLQQQQHGYPQGGYHQQTGYGAPARAPYGHVQPQQQGHPPYGYAQPAPPPPAAHAKAPHTARPGLETWKKEAQDAFVRADSVGSRSLDPRELMEVLQRLGYSVNYPEALRLFGSVDTNQDGKIRMEEFVELYVTLKANYMYP